MYKSSKPLAILLATYNSSKYLEAQLNSLYDQTFLDWELFVRDDGSSDRTLDIVDQYCSKYGNITVVEDGKKHLGAKYSFMALLDMVDAQYYMFCDHDDVWLSGKIDITLSALKEAESANKGKAVVVHTDLTIVDGELNVQNKSMWEYAKIKPELVKQRKYSMACSYMTGCTMGLNRQAKYELALNMPPEALMHDWWIATQAIFKDAVIVSIATPTILYRLHGNNEAGVPRASSLYFADKILRFRKTIEGHRQMFPLLKIFGYGSVIKYYYYKIIYTIKRNF